MEESKALEKANFSKVNKSDFFEELVKATENILSKDNSSSDDRTMRKIFLDLVKKVNDYDKKTKYDSKDKFYKNLEETLMLSKNYKNSAERLSKLLLLFKSKYNIIFSWIDELQNENLENMDAAIGKKLIDNHIFDTSKINRAYKALSFFYFRDQSFDKDYMIEISKDTDIESVIINTDLYRDIYGLYFAYMRCLAVSLYFWKKYKIIYNIDNSLCEEISCKLPMDLDIGVRISNLPFESFYVAMDLGSIDGFFVFESNDLIHIFVFIKETTDFLAFKFPKNEQIMINSDNESFYSSYMHLQCDNLKNTYFKNYNLARKYKFIALNVLCALNYILIANAFTKKISNTTNKNNSCYTKKSNSGIQEISIEKVMIEKAISISSKQNHTDNITESHNNRSGNDINREGIGLGISKSPHVRRGHWHNYWVGSRDDRKLIQKWIPSINVNCDKNEEMPNISVTPVR